MDEIISSIGRWAESSASHTDLPPAVLLDMGLPGLGLARILGRQQVPVVAFDTKRSHWSHHSRYTQVFSSERFLDEEFLIRCLQEIADVTSRRPVVFPLHDDYSILIARNVDRLESIARVPQTRGDTLVSLVEKSGTAIACRNAGIDTPRTFSVTGAADLDSVARKCRFPCLIKPNESRRWQTSEAQDVLMGRKVVSVDDPDDLKRTYDALASITPDVVIQEDVAGPDENLFYVVSYIDSAGEPFGFFVGQKLRTNPPHFGRGCWVRSCENDEVVRLTERLVRETGYRGNIGAEFKYDVRDERYKLIEVNCRFGLWDAFSESCGLPIASAAYRDLAGLPAPDRGAPATGKYWLFFTADFHAGIRQVREKSITPFRWIQAYFRPHTSATFSWTDPVPALLEWREFVAELFSAAWRRLARLVSR